LSDLLANTLIAQSVFAKIRCGLARIDWPNRFWEEAVKQVPEKINRLMK